MHEGYETGEWQLKRDGLLAHPCFWVRFATRLMLWTIGILLLTGLVYLFDLLLNYINLLTYKSLPYFILAGLVLWAAWLSKEKH